MYRIGNKERTAQCRSSIVGENLSETNKVTRQITAVIVPHHLLICVGDSTLTDGLVDVTKV